MVNDRCDPAIAVQGAPNGFGAGFKVAVLDSVLAGDYGEASVSKRQLLCGCAGVEADSAPHVRRQSFEPSRFDWRKVDCVDFGQAIAGQKLGHEQWDRAVPGRDIQNTVSRV